MLKNFFSKRNEDTKKEQSREMESSNLIQRSTIFDAMPIDINECQNYLITLLTAILNGKKFSTDDVNTIFFAITKAYNNKDILLHRYLLLVLRYLNVDPLSAFMITQSVTKDITSNINYNRAFAVRLVPSIISTEKSQIFQSMDRFVKQIIQSNQPYLSMCGLSCALALCLKGFTDDVKKWITEIHSAASSNTSAQHFALLVLYYLRRGDGNVLRKMADQSRERSSNSALSTHVLIQVCSEANKLTGSDSAEQFLLTKLQAASPITQLDAARAILSNERSSKEAISQAVSKLNFLLSYPSSVAVFAALRTIVEYAGNYRDEFSRCNTFLERLLSESDSNVSALAAVSLLHTGFESTIDRVLPVVSQFSMKLSSDQQAALLKSCVEVARRHPNKLEYILNFMWSTFRQIEIYEVQSIFVQGFFNFAEFLKNSQVSVFRYLCEYVEDSKFPEMTLLIVRFIGDKGPEQENRTELVRCLCNRLYLENAEIRAASIDALAKFAECEDIGPSVLHVIKKHLNDADDEVRDRAAFYTTAFEKKYEKLLNIVPPVVVSEVVEEKPVVVIKETPIDVYGKPLFESKEVNLTDKDAEIVVSYITHVYINNIAVEFIITNTLDYEICDVDARIVDEIESNGLELESTIQAKKIEKESKCSIYAIFKRTEPIQKASDLLHNLAFGRYNFEIFFFAEDDDSNEIPFPLDNEIKLMMNIYMKPTTVSNFKNSFDSLAHDLTQVLLLQFNKQEAALDLITQSTGLEIISQNKKKNPKGIVITEVQLAGLVIGEELVLAALEMLPPGKKDLKVKFTVRSNDEELLSPIINSL